MRRYLVAGNWKLNLGPAAGLVVYAIASPAWFLWPALSLVVMFLSVRPT